MRCPYCGNENTAENRFCGMCGRPLIAGVASAPGAAAEAGEAHPPATSQVAPHVAPGSTGSPAETPGFAETPQPGPTGPSPAYTGGMFRLGGAGERHPRNLDYLLEDDEKPRSSMGLMIGIVAALLLAGGLGWLRWRQGNIPGMSRGQAANTAPASGSQTATPAPAPETASADQSSTAAATTPPSSPPASGPSPTPPATASSPATSPTPPSAAAPEASTPGTPTSTEHLSSTALAPDIGNRPSGAGAASVTPAATSESSPAPAAPPAGVAPTASSAEAPTPAKPAPLASTKRAFAPKPAPTPKSDPVTLGEKYLYGRGMPQSCEKGLHYVKPAAEQSNPKAMITMGALYATGLCVARDLPSAYRYFALALRQDPDNAALKQNAEMVWGQMTPTERQQAIRLTQ